MSEDNFEMSLEPDDEDCFITDVTCGGYDVACSGKFIGHFVEYDDAIDAILNWQNEHNYYPSIWFINDHGNVSNVDNF